MGAKTAILMYATQDIASVLRAAPQPDRKAALDLIGRLFPGQAIEAADDGVLDYDTNPPEGLVYIGVYPGLTVICAKAVALDYPSMLDQRFIDAAGVADVYLHAMHSVVDFFTYALWRNGNLVRSLSVAPDDGIIEDLGERQDFEAPYWAGEHPLLDDSDEDGEEPYPLPFHPLELGEAALRSLFGFNLEGLRLADDPDLEQVGLNGFRLGPSAAMPTLELSRGSKVVNPSPLTIESAVRRLERDLWFVVLDRGNEFYMQSGTGPNAGVAIGQYTLEYRDGGSDKHYRCVVHSLDPILNAFNEYLAGTTDWRDRHKWERVIF